ncbi:cytochrome P450 [Nostoc sp. 'Peltigera membranacea cyanobiont' 210A]|uniref:cytochrome P450 n=1 Tax=Nostoc sp. 'Peltigera membranacea cyanobiont' 210A TaxID=2014529 RepID=UPI000B959BC5|nr:cytochrome P450 [Nostoc sp. 'Peltigera membranacea cyanobiont' 210A]OYD95725.1 cytochrome P450 [Nostoc sp. 'Peltigera membranacea cyanobiont' 210A]
MKHLSDYNFFDPEVLVCPYEFYKLAQEQAPIMELPSPTTEAKLFLVTRYDLAIEILKDTRVFSSNFSTLLAGKEQHDQELQKIAALGWPQMNTLLTADPPEHERFRSLVNKAFTSSRINKMRDLIEQIVDELIDSFIDRGKCEFVSEFAVPLPLKVIAQQLGVPQADLPKFKQWSDAFIARLGNLLSREQEIECAKDVVAFQHYFHDVIESRQKQPQDDLITDLVQAKVDGERSLDTAELLSIIQQILVAGNETVTSAIAGGMLLLTNNKEQMKLVQTDISLLENFVEEVLRMQSPTAGMWRVVTEDTKLQDVDLKAGSLVMLRFDAANRDSLKFIEGERFDVRRHNASNHLSFGHGIHFCLGAMLARKEMQIAYQRLLLRLKDIRLAQEGYQYLPNVLMRTLKHLNIEFDKAS